MMSIGLNLFRCIFLLILSYGAVNISCDCSVETFTEKNSTWIISKLPKNFKIKIYHCQINYVERRFDSCSNIKENPNFINITTINVNRTVCMEAIQLREISLDGQSFSSSPDQNEHEYFIYDTPCNGSSNISVTLSYKIKLFDYDGIVDLGKNKIFCRKSGTSCTYDQEHCQHVDADLYWNMKEPFQSFNQLPVFVDRIYSNGDSKLLLIKNKNNLTYLLTLTTRKKYKEVEFWLTDKSDIVLHSKYQNLSSTQEKPYTNIHFQNQSEIQNVIKLFCIFSMTSRNVDFSKNADEENNTQITFNKSQLHLISQIVLFMHLLVISITINF